MATALKNKLMDFIRPLIDLPKLKNARLWSFGLTKSFQRNLLLSIGGVFLLFAVCFSVYQYQRERNTKSTSCTRGCRCTTTKWCRHLARTA